MNEITMHQRQSNVNKNRKMVKTIGSFTAYQRQGYNVLVKHSIDTELNDPNKNRKIYRMHLSEFRKTMGYKKGSMSLDEIAKPLQELQRKSFVEIGDGSYESSSLVPYFKLDEKTNELKWKFTSHVKKVLLDKSYIIINIPTILSLKSSYAIAIYELLKRAYHSKNKEYQFLEYSLEEFRERLGINKKKYTAFGNFDRRVIKPAIKEINNHTELYVYAMKQFGYVKRIRRVVGIKFCFVKANKEQKQYLLDAEESVRKSKKPNA